jgi:thiamine pyrophosphate-dependent acetolactate synthase large subunit-like protein
MLCGIKARSLVTNPMMRVLSRNKITVGEYIVESLVDKEINIAFGHKYGCYSPFYKATNEHEYFDVVFEENELTSGYRALTYSKNTNNMGVIVSTATSGFANLMEPIQKSMIEKRSLLLLSFFDAEDELKSSPFSGKSKSFIKESLTIKNSDNFTNEMECLVMYGYTFPAGPVHLNVANEILDTPIGASVVGKINKDLHPDIIFSKNLCKMHELNAKKMNKDSLIYEPKDPNFIDPY